VDFREVGRGLFGRRTRLHLLVWASRVEGGSFYVKQAVDGLRDSPSAVLAELTRLTDLGMFRRDSHPGDRRVYYTLTDSPLWKIALATTAALEELDIQLPPRTDPLAELLETRLET
jgi:DNA-binding MarR family transcriptional regulator